MVDYHQYNARGFFMPLKALFQEARRGGQIIYVKISCFMKIIR